MAYNKVTGANGKQSSGYFNVTNSNGKFGDCTSLNSYQANLGHHLVLWNQTASWTNSMLCGMTAVAIACSGISDSFITPDELVCAGANGQAIDFNSLNNIVNSSDFFEGKISSTNDQSAIDSCLSSGGMVIFCVAPNKLKSNGDDFWTHGGNHYVVIYKKNNNKYYCCDGGGKGKRKYTPRERANLPFTFAEIVAGKVHEQFLYIYPKQISGYNGGGGSSGISLTWPTKNKQINSGFGMRNSGFHEGIDIAPMKAGISAGEDIVAAAGGTISQVTKSSNGYGNHVKIKVNDDLTMLYGHLSSIDSNIKQGDTVSAGTKLGIMGTTGLSTGVHLHFHIEASDNFISQNNVSKMSDSAQAGSDTSSPAPNKDICYYVGKSGTKYVNPLPYLTNGTINGSGDGGTEIEGYANEWQQNLIRKAIEEELAEFAKKGIKAEVKDGQMWIDLSTVIKDIMKYNNVHKLRGLQHPPADMKRINFKQDYVVIIRKKLFFSATIETEENYLRMYQINNFTNISTSHSVKGNAAQCNIQLKGGERVICVNKFDEKDKNWKSWENLLNGFTNIDNEGETNGEKWRIGSSEWNDPNSSGIDYKNLMKAKEAKYGWRYAEKCDWEPMDELIVFSKSRNKEDRNENGQYIFKKIFFGFIDSVNINFDGQTAESKIYIKATDQLKLLKLSYVNKTPTFFPGRMNGGKIDIRFDSNKSGLIKVYEPYVYSMYNKDEETLKDLQRMSTFEECFSGIYPDIIIKNCCNCAGIPPRYLKTRIEPVKVIPYLFKLKNGTGAFTMTSASFKSRLDYCQEIARICNMEFFCDEEGYIVFKIPNYALGANKLYANNLDFKLDREFFHKNIFAADNKYIDLDKITKLCTLVKPQIYNVIEGETIRDISKKFFGSINYSTEIQYLNLGSLQNYSSTSKLKKMKILILSYDVNNPEARKEYKNLINNGDISRFVNQLFEENNNINVDLKNEKWSLSMQTDIFIPEIPPEDIIKFSISDSDDDVYTTASVQGQSFMGKYDNDPYMNIKRSIPDLQAILRFGVRPAPEESTPFINNENDAELYGECLLKRSYASRYTGTVNVIENPSIKVGNPVRLFIFDEHVGQETGYLNEEAVPAQCIYYVEAIKRNITPNGVSTMELTLVAGRMFGQESIYEAMIPLYSQYYTEPKDIDSIKAEELYQQLIAQNSSGDSETDDTGNSDDSGRFGNSGGNSNASSENKVRDEIWNFFINNGYSEKRVAAICGNVYQECTYNPTHVNGDQYGLFQWRAGRRTGFENYCKKNNLDIKTVRPQCEWALYELTEGNQFMHDEHIKTWKNDNSSIEEYTKAFSRGFLRPSAKWENLSRRIEGANDAYNAYCK